MIILTETHFTRHAAAPMPHALRGFLRLWTKWRHPRPTGATLNALSDHQLRDIGLLRDQITGLLADHP